MSTPSKRNSYDRNFYATYQDTSRRSARHVLSSVFDVVQPRRVVDIGCGIGTWLAEASELGVEEILGVDGDYVDREQLLIDKSQFIAANLAESVNLNQHQGSFDLAMSLEVAEHLPESAADRFVKTLTSLSDVVLFSAAIPNQGGDDHINEQWPGYWAKRFAAQDYAVLDVVRPRFWDNSQVAYYYAQNTFLYVKRPRLTQYPSLTEHEISADHWTLRSVHPERWRQAHDPNRVPLRFAIRATGHAAFNAAQRRLRLLADRG